MRIRQRLYTAFFVLILLAAAAGEAGAEQTIVFFRHGEKPSGGLGQLTCQGLNRALALPAVLAAKFDRPSYLYAPNPAVKMNDPAGGYLFYVRPLATIEPTAIQLGLSVNTRYGYTDITGLQNILDPDVEGEHHDFRGLGARAAAEGRPEPHERPWRRGGRAGMDTRRLRQSLHRPRELRGGHDHCHVRTGSRRPERPANQLPWLRNDRPLPPALEISDQRLHLVDLPPLGLDDAVGQGRARGGR